MTEVLRYEVGSGTVLVEVDEDSYGVDRPARNEQGILDAGRRLEEALAAVRPAASAAVDALAELAPEEVEITFGIKLAGDAGAIIARNCGDAHFVVRMSWSGGPAMAEGEEE
ncbi:CU044_2847 family protein [Arthrobacter mangrovi]|uniref:Trypsin-co-occurring domain-containing protein n=1 Tax=Arthrobacter mangrovi TaxID=2966350 RepID=A0ABQ5MW36_9MICC|nr:CU044_2847 family protein [Arthrobacter mangrovi]GLB68197.1 hypothetical protein AHIS1636_26390 [Arthrobacter mangrovi]